MSIERFNNFAQMRDTPTTFRDIIQKADRLRFACMASMDCKTEAMRIIPKAEQHAFLEELLLFSPQRLDDKMWKALPRDFHPKTHDAEGRRNLRRPLLRVLVAAATDRDRPDGEES